MVMRIVAIAATVIVALLHFYFLWLEMFLWTEEAGRSLSGFSLDLAEKTAVLAANQGLYNGFLGAGLIWAVVAGKHDVRVFFLLCVVIAGLYGAWSTGSLRILLVQGGPALIALICTLLTTRR